MTHPLDRLPDRYETNRLVIRRYTEDDANWFYPMSLRNREHLRRYESGNVVMSLTSLEHARETLRELAMYWDQGACYFLGAFDKQTKAFAAQIYVGLFQSEPTDFIIGYFADCEHEGKGLVSEAVQGSISQIFSHLGAHHVRIHCNETNLRSQAVAARCGFREASRYPETRMGPDGQPRDVTTISYLRRRDEISSSRMNR